MRRIQTSFTRKLIWSIKISLRKIFLNIYAKFIFISTKIFASHIKKVEGVKRKMATTYKVCVCDGLTTDIEDTICFRPNGDTYDDFMEEILIRMPELRTETLRVFYQGKLRPFFYFYCTLSILFVPLCELHVCSVWAFICGKTKYSGHKLFINRN